MKVHTLFLNIVLIFLCSQHVVNGSCTFGYFGYSDTTTTPETTTCLGVKKMKLSFSEALDVCQTDGGTLAQIGLSLQESILPLIKDGSGMAYWLGGTDLKLENSWKWLNGEEMNANTVIWSSSPNQEPDGGTAQNCAALAPEDYFMHSESCSDEIYFICQMDPI